ncbi:MAG: hypothetical protein R3E31_22265 [Chloroflexota bacterium]
MMELIDSVEQIKLLSGAFVDYGYRQGKDAILKQFNQRSGENEEDFVDNDIKNMKDTIAALMEKLAPYDIPKDYIFFLDFMGVAYVYRWRNM